MSMCARFSIATVGAELIKLLDLPFFEDMPPRYNIAPGQWIMAAAQVGARKEPKLFWWGLIPSWTQDEKISHKLINARVETIAEKPSFRPSFIRRRCLIPATSFFEWINAKAPKEPLEELSKNAGVQMPLFDTGRPIRHPKQPYKFWLMDETAFCLAGIWNSWQAPTGEEIDTCSIITTSPNDLMSHFHDRMPGIVRRKDYNAWLDPKCEDPRKLIPLVSRLRSSELCWAAVDMAVNNVKNDGPELIKPIA